MTSGIESRQKLVTAEQLVHRLIDVGEFGNPTVPIRLIETHISWILLTGTFAYKIKKPVDLGFLDFSTLELRHKYCLLELDLNRRLAPEVYLDVVSIGGQPESPAIGGLPALEWAVRMRQFSDEARLDRQIQLERVSADDMRTFGENLALLHEKSLLAQASEAHGSVGAISGVIEENFSTLTAHSTDPTLRDRLVDLRDWSQREVVRVKPILEYRKNNGRVRQCHGDLHLENLVMIGNQITPFDCIEFDAGLRYIDVMNEVAFLFMDLLRVARPDLAYSFLDRYLEVSADYEGAALLPLYSVYRCLVRAKIATLRQVQSDRTDTSTDVHVYIKLAERLARPNRGSSVQPPPCLVVCRGLSGSGKTYLSSKLLLKMPAIRIRSDIVRKYMHNMGELESSGSSLGEGLYDSKSTLRTYERLGQLSTIVLTAGCNVIVDATSLRHADRLVLQLAAEKSGATYAILNCTVADPLLARRVALRHAVGDDASEADRQVLDWQRANVEPLTDDEQRRALTIDTGEEYAVGEIARRLRNIACEN